MKALFDGMLTGFILQLAIGPVFFFIFGITIDTNYTNCFFSILAVTIVDYIFIILSLFGVEKLLGDEKRKKIIGFISMVVLIIFGLLFLYKGIISGNKISGSYFINFTPLKSFISCFILTISSPLTIIFWSSIFTAKAIEKNYMKNQLYFFGIGAGFTTFLFLSISMYILSLIKVLIPYTVVKSLNFIVGLVIIYYGISRLLKNIKSVVVYNRTDF